LATPALATPPRGLISGLTVSIDAAQLRIKRPEAASDQPIGRCRNSFPAETLGWLRLGGESPSVSGMRHLSAYWGSRHTRVFTDTVRSCKCVFELVLACLADLTATPLATPLAKFSSALVFP
jgi:hypothetical protein